MRATVRCLQSTPNPPFWSYFHNCHPSHLITVKHCVDDGCRTTPSWETAGMDIQHTTGMKLSQVRIGMVPETCKWSATYITVKLLSSHTFSYVTGLNVHLKENSPLYKPQFLSEHNKSDVRNKGKHTLWNICINLHPCIKEH